VRKRRHGGPVVDEDAENVTLFGRLGAEIGGQKRAPYFDPPIAGSKCRHVIATSEEGGRKSDVPDISVTRSDIGDGSGALP